MPKVDFYQIQQETIQAQFFFACRLTEKVLAQGMHVYLHTDNNQQAQELDDLLWSFRPQSYIPHELVGQNQSSQVPVLIGYNLDHIGPKQILINLANVIPENHSNYERIVEIVINEESSKQNSRQHWNSYKAHGYPMQHNKV